VQRPLNAKYKQIERQQGKGEKKEERPRLQVFLSSLVTNKKNKKKKKEGKNNYNDLIQ
jgi:hypothetical protein